MQKKRSLRKILILVSIVASILAAPLGYITMGPLPRYTTGFATLTDLQMLAKQRDENTPLTGTNTIRPLFTDYYKTFERTWKRDCKARFFYLLELLHIRKKPLWSASFFAQQLAILAKQRSERSFKDNHIVKITCSPEMEIAIFGNIQGALHSLIRGLTKLKELGFVHEDLTMPPHHVIIFMGDVVSRSPFSMETLSVVMKLLEKNPENVVYLRGNHESNNYWQEHSLKSELQMRASYLMPNASVPLEAEVNQLFDSLPVGAYIKTLNPSGNEFIRISDLGRTQHEWMQENAYESFLTQKSEPFTIFQQKEKPNPLLPDAGIKIRVIFKGEKKRETFQTMTGLRFLSPDIDSVAWNILSCPTVVYQRALKFSHDAFVVLKPHLDTDQWRLILYNRDVHTDAPFKATIYMLTSGLEESKDGTPGKPAPREDSQSNSAPVTPPATTQPALNTTPATAPTPTPMLIPTTPALAQTTPPVIPALPPAPPAPVLKPAEIVVQEEAPVGEIKEHVAQILQHAQKIQHHAHEIELQQHAQESK